MEYSGYKNTASAQLGSPKDIGIVCRLEAAHREILSLVGLCQQVRSLVTGPAIAAGLEGESTAPHGLEALALCIQSDLAELRREITQIGDAL